MSAPFASPKTNISSLLKFSRYAALGLGIMYGSWRLKSLSKKEVGIQENENAIKVRRDARLAREQKEAERVEMNKLAEEVGVPDRI